MSSGGLNMVVNVERIIQYIKHGDQDNVQIQLEVYNSEFSQCFFFNVEEREMKKQLELEEFRRNKFRDHSPDVDSDLSDTEDDPDLIQRRRLAAALMWFIRTKLQPQVLRACLRTLRILSRDRLALAPLETDDALMTFAHLGGLTSLPMTSDASEGQEYGVDLQEAWFHEGGTTSAGSNDAQNRCNVSNPNSENASSGAARGESDMDTQSNGSLSSTDSACSAPACVHDGACRTTDPWDGGHDCALMHFEVHGGKCGNSVLERGKRDVRGERDEEEEGSDDVEVWRKEAMKALCNVIYNSQRAQERASALRLLSGLSERLKKELDSPLPPAGQFYELRLLFLLTALRPELRLQLQQERGVSLLTSALEQCLSVKWMDVNEVQSDPTAPPVRKEVSEKAVEILKTLFNVTHDAHRNEPDEEECALYRRLAAVLRHCMLLSCEGEELDVELKGHAVNLLSALPLQCLDVLLSGRLSTSSVEWEGLNMDCVRSLLQFLERRLDAGHKLKEKLTPVLNLLTESSKVHRGTRHYLKQQILPPLRDLSLRPEQGTSVRSRLVRLMTHVDTDIKHCAAELLFVLCKENVRRFVKYTGYGNAAGLLAARGLLSGCGPYHQSQYSSDSDSDSDTEEYRHAKGRINPVTGRVEEEQPDPMEGMTEEEKEAEARKLIWMFNRLSRDKIIQPMGVTAEGRLAPLYVEQRVRPLQEQIREEDSEEDLDE
ncbi:synembryn-A isoform X2 [Denticeps clupeoides]|uniref:synembryn-A isoform X2 n=1 Tax=Denticeps clupeoides TaxID=299321 RepID=UPI0010A581E2|nr:synembryn-A-like isoform X2 [Denticeps clupeoides]